MIEKKFKALMGTRIKKARLSVVPKMTRESLAEKLGVSPTTIYRWETGADSPTHENLEKLVKRTLILFDLPSSNPSLPQFFNIYNIWHG